MDDEFRKEIVREELRKKNKGKKSVPSRYRMRYPDSAEREYMRLANSYMAIEREALRKYIPELKRILNGGTRHNTDAKKDNETKRRTARFSTIDDIVARLGIFFESIQKELGAAFGLYNLKRALERIAGLNHRLTVAEWKKVVRKTLGINILEDYYSGGFYQVMLGRWVSDNVELIRTIPRQSLGKMKEIVYQDYMNGRPTTDIIKAIQHQYGMDKRHARLIARDQTAKLNAKINKSQQMDAGVKRYEWSDSADGRVRRSHRRLNGHIFRWDDPPKTDGGRRCHPGEDYQCRCCAIPVFDIDTLELPI